MLTQSHQWREASDLVEMTFNGPVRRNKQLRDVDDDDDDGNDDSSQLSPREGEQNMLKTSTHDDELFDCL